MLSVSMKRITTLALLFQVSVVGMGLQSCSVINKGSKQKATTSPSKADKRKVEAVNLSDREKQKFQSAYFEGIKNKHIGNTSRAITQFRKSLAINPGAAAAHYELSRLLEKQNANDSSVMHAKKAVATGDSAYWYLKHLGELYRNQERYQEAAGIMQAIIDQHEEGPKFYYQLANVYIRQEKLEKALETYERFEQNFGVNPQVVRQQKRIYLQMDKVEKAAEAVRGLIEANPQKLSAYRQLAKLYMANDMEDKAKKVYDEMAAIAPDNGKTQLALAQFYSDRGKQDQAYKHLKKAFADAELSIDKKVKFMISNYLQTQLNSTQKAQALELANIITQAHPNSAKAYATKGDLFYQNEQPQKAMGAYEQSLQYAKDNFSVWQNLLQIYLQEGQYSRLAQKSAKALTYFPNQPILYYFHGLGLKENDKIQEAVKQFESGLNLVSGNQQLKTQFYSNLGMTYHDMEEYAQSEKYFEKALELNPGDPYVLNNFSWYLALRGDSLSRAEKMSAKTLERKPKNSAYLDTYGWIQYKKGNYQNARKYINKALQQAPKDPELLEHYGDVLFKMDQTDEAVKYWKKAKSQGGGSEELNQKISNRQLVK